MNEDGGCGSPLALGLLNLARSPERSLRKLNYRGGWPWAEGGSAGAAATANGGFVSAL